ncbi:MAG: ABC transporter substrate-binding protein [Hyphomicrobiaceae bacterium]|nr:ABC transporter substrate-binding protein [Hyphomicrobiaceae bacterium]
MLRKIFVAGAGALLAAGSGAAEAQTPKKGGTLNFAVVAEPPTIDCHAVTTFAFAHPGLPHYSKLLKWKGNYDNLKIVGDLAESWEMSPDGLTFTFKLHKDVKFHDGAPMTSEDVKASYERIINPPQGVVSARRALHSDIGSIETPDAHTVVFKLKQPNASMLIHFASPWNCIYRAAKLKEDPQFPAKTVLGTGAYQFVEYVKGSHWSAKRFDGYFQKDRPYLDGYKAYFVKSNAVVPGMLGGQFDGEFRGRTPKERDQLVAGMKDNATVIEGPWVTNLMFTFNTKKKPFDDVRVRQALTMAVDRYAGADALSKISMLKYVSGLLRPGYEYALAGAELEKLPGFSKDIEKSRAEAKKLLADAGVPNLKVKLVNRNVAEPYTPGGIYLIDQWRRIGVDVEHSQLETKLFFDAMKQGNFDVLIEFISDFADDPSAQFDKLLTTKKSSQAASFHEDGKLDELFDKQAMEVDPAKRKALVNEFERHALTQAYSAPLLWWQRIIVHHKKIKGWEHQANHFTATDLVDVWLDQ